MRKNNFKLILLLASCIASAQHYDHRNRQVDSLEQVLAINPPEGKELASIYNGLMRGYQEISTEKSMEYARKYIDIAVSLERYHAVSLGYKISGINFYKISQYDSAMVCYEKALEAIERMRDFPEEYDEGWIDDWYASTYGNMGNVYNIQGKYHEAIEYYTKALKLFEKHGYRENQASAYYNIGELYMSMNNYEQAEINYTASDKIGHEINDSLVIAFAKKGLSALFLYRKDYDKALQNAAIAYHYYFSHPEEGIEKAAALNLLSEIYLEGYSDDRQAEIYVLQALETVDSLGIPREKAISLQLLSAIHLRRNEWRKAEQTALSALEADDSEPANTLSIYEVLTKAYAHLGEPTQADAYFDKHNELQSSWSNKNFQSALTEMQIIYETEKKELVIEQQQSVIIRQNMQHWLLWGGVTVCMVILALLWYMLRLRIRRNRALAERNNALVEMNATKDKFFSIISHDLKNPAITQLEAVRQLVYNAGSWDFDTLTGYYNKLLKSAEGHVELIYNLLGWAQLQTGRMTYTPATIILSSFLPDIALIRKMAENKGITLTAQIPVDAIITGDGNMLATVIRNLLNNAVKFTAEGGTVALDITPHCDNIAVHRDHERLLSETETPCMPTGRHNDSASDATCNDIPGYTVTISDSGIGMSREQINRLFASTTPSARYREGRGGHLRSVRGTAGEQGSGLGLIVCMELLEKHGTKLHVESEEGKGSRFWFEV